MNRISPNNSDVKRIRELFSLGWPAHAIADELNLSEDTVMDFAPPPDLSRLMKRIVQIQKDLDDESLKLGETTTAVLNAQKVLPDLKMFRSGIEDELRRLSDRLARTQDDLESADKRIRMAQDGVAAAQSEQLSVQENITDFQAQMNSAESSLDKYDADISEKKRIEGLTKVKQRKAAELAQMAIEAAVGDKLERILMDKL